ncbi:DUF4325 domain-containing protein [Streptococcus anginosus]|uniref:STAS-like domain-containing protein n=1 Tax=Streptococcus anginosus TaxID=1328 RepID=UPI001C8CE4A2|nr:DUF4325 domain-containing protein [Streptococcus anginosus]MBX9075490.1 DUF4325 domain-containing protein [Streptococcus anginosus]
MMKKIELDFDRYDRTLISLSGRKFGEKTYNDQVAPYIEKQEKVTLVFPNKIEVVASSFVQGLFYKELEEIGLNSVKSKFTIESKVNGFAQNFWGSLD